MDRYLIKMKQILNVNNLTVCFSNTNVLENVSFDLYEGQYLAVIGHNGAGKSTLLKTLIKENKLYKGDISLKDGFSLGYVAQQNNDGSYFPATTLEVIKSGFAKRLFNFGLSVSNKKQLDKVISELDLENLINQSYYNLSGGQKRTVLLARALCAGSRLLILDEPASGLDNHSSKRLYKIIRKLNQQFNITVIMVCHDIKTVCAEADSVLYLDRKVKYFGNAYEFIKTDFYKKLEEHIV